MKNEEKFPCPICGNLCLSEPVGSFDICDVCGWEDDNVGRYYPDEPGINGDWALNDAKEAWAKGETLFERFPNPKGS